MFTNILALVVVTVFLLNLAQLPLMMIGEGFLAIVRRETYRGLGESTMAAKHVLWAEVDPEDKGAVLLSWLGLDLAMGFMVTFVLLIGLATGILQWILGLSICAVLFTLASRYITDRLKAMDDE